VATKTNLTAQIFRNYDILAPYPFRLPEGDLVKIVNLRYAGLTVLGLAAVGAAAITIFTFNTPTANAQVGVPYNSSCSATGGTPPLTYSISAGALPNSLTLNTATGAITGTPTASGIFIFTCSVVDSPQVTGNSPAAANRRAIAQSGTPTASAASAFAITVAPAAPSPTPVPPSIWMAALGLGGAAFFGRRRFKRA
jgi:MYXO-CTERM domain-containing protein